jgi:hypothetical protein
MARTRWRNSGISDEPIVVAPSRSSIHFAQAVVASAASHGGADGGRHGAVALIGLA